ncbi:MAG: hypothetical protein JXJ17_08010 [Anaerolineae bacterium]|nr:hypothetical protein [Anaerolineae bacterium]
MGRSWLIGTLLAVLMIPAAANLSAFAEQPAVQVPTPLTGQAITPIPLEGMIAEVDSEISGLAWYGDMLILLPQYPDWNGFPEDGYLYGIPKQAILDYLDGKSTTPIEPETYTVSAPNLTTSIIGFQGFEAIGFAGNKVYLTIESQQSTSAMLGYLISGTILPEEQRVELDTTLLTPIPPQAEVTNATDEALVVTPDGILTFYEGNGVLVNPTPVAHVFDPATLAAAGTLPLDSLDRRITDATDIDENNRFWVLNVSAPIFGIEQIVEYEYTGDRIVQTGTTPVVLNLIEEYRNWEGLARLDDRGFLIVTDKIPDTTLAFVATPAGAQISPAGLTLDENITEPTTYEINLTKAPTAPVTVEITTEDMQTTVSPTTLTFTSTDWEIPQIVTLSVVDDLEHERSPHNGVIVHAMTSTDTSFQGQIVEFTVNITDNDPPPPPAVLVDVPDVGLIEGGEGIEYTVVLSTKPEDAVELVVSSDSQTVALPHNLTFLPSNWDEPQTVSLRAKADTEDENGQTSVIQHTASSSDPDYDGLTAEITVQIEDAPIEKPGKLVLPDWTEKAALIAAVVGVLGLMIGFFVQVKL